MIASGLSIGISKRELMEDYYIDEIPEIIRAWNAIHGKADDGENVPTETDPMKFFGEGGEILG